MEVWYCTREDVLAALDVPEVSWRAGQIDRIIQGSSRGIEGDLGRYFYPLVSTQTFDWPDHQFSLPWRYWLDQRELLAVTQVLAAGVDITTSVMLRPDDAPMRGKPFTKMEIDLSTSAAFNSGATYQRSISVTGTFGYCQAETAGGSMVSAFTDTTGTIGTVTDSTLVGVGNILRIDSERMAVTGKAMVTTGQTLTSALTALANSNSFTVASAATLIVGESIQVDAEQMMITSITANTVTVQRGIPGQVMAVHNIGATVYAPRQVTVTRGVLGTTAATHTANTPINVHLVPPLIRELCVAETISSLGQERRGYTTIVKRATGGNVGPSDPLDISAALDDLRRKAASRYLRVRKRTAARSI